MQICKESSRCVFFHNYAQQEAFRAEHFNYFCFGPLAENCARRIFQKEKGTFPRNDYSPTGLIFSP